VTAAPINVHLVGNRSVPDVAAALQRAGAYVRTIDVDEPTTAATVAAIVHAVRADGARRVIVAGGDGMVHAGVNALAPLAAAGLDVSLGVVAIGTGNDFARAVGVPIDDVDAAARIAIGAATSIDLLHCEYGWMATVATCGFPARVNDRANRMRWPRGSSRYTLATLLLMPRLRADSLTVRFDEGSAERGPITILAVANTGWFGGGMHIVPCADPTDGVTHVLRTTRLGRLSLMRYLPTVFTGRHVGHASTTIAAARCVHVDGPTEVELWGDGERLGPLPVRIELMPAALAVATGN
jgi:diacylglycerol kinase (ATP)